MSLFSQISHFNRDHKYLQIFIVITTTGFYEWIFPSVCTMIDREKINANNARYRKKTSLTNMNKKEDKMQFFVLMSA